jgi:hypothetical protein
MDQVCNDDVFLIVPVQWKMMYIYTTVSHFKHKQVSYLAKTEFFLQIQELYT